jgi:hypothetical protein
VGEPQTWTVTLDDMVAFAQEGWYYPLANDDATREQIRAWLDGERPEPTPDGMPR